MKAKPWAIISAFSAWPLHLAQHREGCCLPCTSLGIPPRETAISGACWSPAQIGAENYPSSILLYSLHSEWNALLRGSNKVTCQPRESLLCISSLPLLPQGASSSHQARFTECKEAAKWSETDNTSHPHRQTDMVELRASALTQVHLTGWCHAKEPGDMRTACEDKFSRKDRVVLWSNGELVISFHCDLTYSFLLPNCCSRPELPSHMQRSVTAPTIPTTVHQLLQSWTPLQICWCPSTQPSVPCYPNLGLPPSSANGDFLMESDDTVQAGHVLSCECISHMEEVQPSFSLLSPQPRSPVGRREHFLLLASSLNSWGFCIAI